jgi:hypothetical protein
MGLTVCPSGLCWFAWLHWSCACRTLAWTVRCLYGLDYLSVDASFYDTSMGHYTWYLVPCNELSPLFKVFRYDNTPLVTAITPIIISGAQIFSISQ